MISDIVFSANAVRYAVHQLARRAGIGGSNLDILDVALCYSELSTADPERPRLIIAPCPKSAWSTLLSQKANSLTWLPAEKVLPDGASLPIGKTIPVLIWGAGYEDGDKPFAERRDDGSIVFYADIIASTLFMLTRWEEMVSSAQDMHGRFPAEESVAFKQRFLDRPIVDEYALVFGEWLQVLYPTWCPLRPKFSVKLSHDIDAIGPFKSPSRAFKKLGGDLLKRHDLSIAYQTASRGVKQAVMPGRTREFAGIWKLTEISHQVGLSSAFYFMTSEQTPRDSGYNPYSRPVRECILDLRRQGHEIGFHPSYDTHLNPAEFFREKARFDSILGDTYYGGRQHYLRFQAPDTWRTWEVAGMAYDSTVGYADHEGFRCGTSHAFQPFDLATDRELKVWEYPLIAMDVTLRVYRQLGPSEAELCLLELAKRCKKVGGNFTLLWHNTSLSGPWYGWETVYQRVVLALRRMI